MSRYSDIVMDHLAHPRNLGRMENPDRMGLAGVPGQGPYILLCLRMREGRVVEARYQSHICVATVAAGSMLTVMITDRTIEECLAISADQLMEALGGVPPDKVHAPALAVAALRAALKDAIPAGSCETG